MTTILLNKTKSDLNFIKDRVELKIDKKRNGSTPSSELFSGFQTRKPKT